LIHSKTFTKALSTNNDAEKIRSLARDFITELGQDRVLNITEVVLIKGQQLAVTVWYK
jgi:hypothetical protein